MDKDIKRKVFLLIDHRLWHEVKVKSAESNKTLQSWVSEALQEKVDKEKRRIVDG
jgi:predicted HicB family RNase H-like nuclease